VHCEPSIRNTAKAVELSQRACSLNHERVDFIFTLATSLYRDSQWEASLATLEKIESKLGQLDGQSLFLSALCHHQLQSADKAERDLQRGIRWLQEMSIRAAEDPALRIQLEFQRSSLESLNYEAIQLIRNKPDA
jgi:hypothetical protein